MILFDNSLIKLNYHPAYDILEVAYPDLHEFLLREIKHSIDIIIENIINYDIKRVLLDSSKTIIAVDVDKSRQITSYLTAGLMRTRIQRLARIQSLNATVETTAQSNIKYVRETLSLPFELKSFPSKTEASEWLKTSLS